MRRSERSTLRQIFEHVRLYNCLLKITFNMVIRKLRKMLKTVRNGAITLDIKEEGFISSFPT